eukprot:TRINITY_DN10278_c1_g4_i1.p1 TRINITY_DN10278_c1_g4~~TRINITY_DN10278_c1_g4_i1.p1  ORF type:complete len:6273 (+),score=1514.01 TRINITY_DN10278_c1_g4_i1:2553-18821(+)
MVVSGDMEYSMFSPTSIDATNADDDVRDIVVTILPVGATSLTVYEDPSGAVGQFTVVLKSQPTASVAIGISSSDTTEGILSTPSTTPSASPLTLTFTTTTWNVPQTIIVTGVDDFVDDGDVSFTITTAAATSTDTNYKGLNPPDVSARCINNDKAGVTVTQVTSQTTEKGGTATFTVVLTSQPTSSVTMTISSSDTTEGTVSPTSLTFSASTWNIPSTVTVTGVDDLVADGNIAFSAITAPITSLDPKYNNVNPDDAYFTNIDDDTAGIYVTPTSLAVAETGTSATFTINLMSQPTADVTVEGISRNPHEGTTAPGKLIFSSVTWKTPQTVTVTGVDDWIDDGDVSFNVTVVLTSGDNVYDGLSTTDVQAINADNDTAGITVIPTSGLVTSEDGKFDTFTVVLNSQPVADVTMSVSSMTPTEGSVTPASVLFTTSNWNVVRTITVSGVDDFIADGNKTYTINTHPVTSTDPKYNNIFVSNVTALNIDNDVAGIIVDPSSGLITTERNQGSATFTVVLTSQPTADVTIGISSQDTTEGVLQPGLTNLVFTNVTWNIKQQVTVTGVDDTLQDGNIAYTIDLASAVSADPKYNNQNPVDVSLTNLDDDTPGLFLEPNNSLVTKELGAPIGPTCTSSCGNDKIDIHLTSIPVVGTIVKFCVGVDDATEAEIQSPASKTLQFDSTNWNKRQTIEVSGVHDFIDDGNQPFNVIITACGSTDPNYMSWPPAPGIYINGTNIDEDTAGLEIIPVSGIVTSETGTSGKITVRLNTKPVNPVFVKIKSDLTEDSLTSATNTVPSSQLTLQFDTDNTNGFIWNVVQTVTITGVDDYIDDGDQTYNLSITSTSVDAPYNPIFHPGVIVTNEDNDTAAVIVVVPTLLTDSTIVLGPGGELVTTEAMGTSYFDVVLASQPMNQVTVHTSSSDVTEGTTSPGSLIFFASNWNVSQRVTVTGVPDDIQDGNIQYTAVVGPVVSADPKYNGLNPNDVPCINMDDDVAGIFVSGTKGGSMTAVTSESGGTAAFTVALTSQPTASVTISFESQNKKEGTVYPSSMTFTSSSWSTTQTMTVTGVDDNIADGDVLYTVDIHPAVSLDPIYNGMTTSSLQLTNTDNDVAGFDVTPTSGLSVTEDGTTTTFTVVLATQPQSTINFDATIDPSSKMGSVTVSPVSISFTDMNWNVPQTFTITGLPDHIIETVDPVITIDVAVNTASTFDTKYKALPSQTVNVTNIDVDKPGIKVLDTTLTTQESGTSATFKFALNSIPQKNVTIDLVISDTTEGAFAPGQLSTVTFIAGAPISTEYPVTIVGVDDSIADGDITYRVITQASQSLDPNYNGINPIDVTVINKDDDTAGVSITTPMDPNGNNPSSYVYSTSEAGDNQQFIIKLTSQPVSAVRVTVTSSDPTEGLVSEQRQAGLLTQLILEWVPTMWNQAKTVTVNGVDDSVADGDIAYTVTFDISSIDPAYSSLVTQTRRMNNIDNDVASINVYDITDLTTTEGGGRAWFSVNLGSQPVGPVQISVASSKPTEGTVYPTTLVFSTTNWQQKQVVNITGVDDFVDDGDQQYEIFLDPAVSDDKSYSGLVTKSTISVVNKDNDYSGAKLTPIIGGCYVDDSSNVLVNGKNCIFPFLYNSVMYTTCAQSLVGSTLWCPTAVNSTGEPVSGSQGRCNANCTGGLTTTEGLSVSNAHFSTSAQFMVTLTSSPTNDVTINLLSDDTTEGTVSPTQLIFSTGSWNTPQTVTVTAVDDSIADGNQPYNIVTSPCISKDPTYNGIVNPPDMPVLNLDDDVAQLVMRRDTPLQTSEAGTKTYIYVKLGSQPQAGVSLTVNVTDTTEGAASPMYVLFTSTTWNIERTITITGVDDGIDDGDITYDVILDSLLSTDDAYKGLSPVYLPVQNLAVWDECVENQHICLAAGQLCKDPNTSPLSKGDWTCNCQGSSTGSARRAVATCTATGECIANGQICTAAGQSCFDRSTASNDWVCRCVAPAVGNDAIGRVATCELDECTTHASECQAVGQTCEDPNKSATSLDDWMCKCPSPRTGSRVTGVATCDWKGECATRYSICTNKGQTCNDPDLTITGDWECLCVIGQGRATAAAASCLLDECLVNSDVCTSVEQVCVDPNQAPDSLGDWYCKCQGSDAEGTASAMPATCIIDECKANRGVCLAVGQVCVDPNTSPSSKDDWTCNCVEPAIGSAQRTTATCEWQGACKANYRTCTAVGQTCFDPTPNQIGNGNTWLCACVTPYRLTSKVGAAATCILDECDENRHICTKMGQLCLDPNTDPRNTGDWLCQCASPAVGQAVAAPALCAFQGECVEKASICTAAGQTCYDPNVNVAGDWQCVCVSPQNGSRTGLPASCTHDECNEYWQICASYGQLCYDPTPVPSKTGDWTCMCPPPAIGSAKAKFATCSFSGACIDNSYICTTRGQTCEAEGSTFKCKCIGQSTGEKVGNYSTDCEHDECLQKNSICAAANQICVDRNKKSTSLDDWGCQCSGGANSGFSIGGVATCILDECVSNGVTCTEVGQRCIDPDTDPYSAGDWYCLCQGSSTGQAIAQAADCVFVPDCATLYTSVCRAKGQTCVDPEESIPNNAYCQCVWPYTKVQSATLTVECELDECNLYGEVCSNVGQVCIDPKKATGSTGDWTCDCSGGGGTGIGTAVAKPAVCTYVNECEQRAVICNRAGQTCYDPQDNVRNNWECRCVTYDPLATPGKKSGGVADQCNVDECDVYKKICSGASQTCIDPNKSPTSRGDWTCNCEGSNRVGTAVASQAVCILDECIANAQVCNAVGQECQDLVKDPSSLNDWVCNCVSPESGSQKRSVATCTEVGECEANAATCHAAGQACNDPNTASSGDWECVCVGALSGRATGKVATCVLDECIKNAATCNAVGQICYDPNKAPASTGDWECQCLAPATGTTRAQAATCSQVGECIANAVTCTAAGQACRDPDTTRVGDWECVCVGGQEGRKTGRPATCLMDECKRNAVTCAKVGQTCRDPTTSSLETGDWQCDCVGLSASGSQRAGVATCTWTGECAANHQICTAGGQTCFDPSATAGDWMCQCVFPQVGSRKGKLAPCVLDECLEAGLVCAQNGQRCVDTDTNPLSLNDWKCMCEGSASGSAKAAVADCVYEGECTTHASTCSAAGQACGDPDFTVTGDWGCLCISPFLGGAVASAAQCTFDECLIYGSLCSSVGQICDDKNKDAKSRGDWVCNCAGQGTRVGDIKYGQVATCQYVGECTNVANSAICTAKGQTCVDRNTNKANDWECSCVAPMVGAATGQPATCTLNECDKYGDICVSVGQKCVDPKTFADSLNDWTCECTGSQETGSAVGGVAVCTLDECTIEANRDVCATVGQICKDNNVDPTSKNDWYCKCAGSGTGSALMKAATCTYSGECKDGYLTCASSGQYCIDPDETRSGNWECRCVPPYTGSAVATVAVCEYDECTEKSKICTNADQTCTDPNKSPSSRNDWYCECASPLVGKGVTTAATCSFVGECVSNAGTCTSLGQTCVDPDTSVAGDWMCVCVLPQTGNNATASAASCQLDECLLHGSVCTSVGQQCIDPDTSPQSTDDWTCNCFGAGSGSARGIAAVCTYAAGECQTNAKTCAAAGQACNDPDPTKPGDWECKCVPPTQGTGVASTSSCVLDECIENANICQAKGQLCNDPNTSPSSIGDWTCECTGSGTGSSLRSPALCTWAGECQVQKSRCVEVGQTCYDVDPSPTSLGNWKCQCVGDQQGEATGQRALCRIDECTTGGNSAVCEAEHQDCVDPDTNVTSMGDWECRCRAPSSGSAVQSTATCILDECGYSGSDLGSDGYTKCASCAANRNKCEQSNQKCQDPDASRGGDWECVCQPPQVGSAVGIVATCEFDECLKNGVICTSVGQKCVDPVKTTTSTNDWKCVCQGTASGEGKAQKAVCTYPATDPCQTSASKCTNEGQACAGTDTSYECRCIAPQEGVATAAVATCVLDECVTNKQICNKEGQICLDPNTSPTSTGDWVCRCTGSATGVAKARAARCVLDECVANGHVCTGAGQKCVDRDTDPSSSGDWACTCIGSSSGSAKASVATCAYTGECSENSQTCTASGQGCYDPSPSVGDWYCICVDPATPIKITARSLAVCELDECEVKGDICTNQGQSCLDDNKRVQNDWVCKCEGSGTGTKLQGPATCTFQTNSLCNQYANVCQSAGQACVTDGQGWSCRCAAPAEGDQVGGVAPCTLDECTQNRKVCTAQGQSCTDPNTDYTSLNDWRCVCTGDKTVGFGVAAPATCLLDECKQYGSTCTAVGQVCNDPNLDPTSVGDWVCSCLGSAQSAAGKQVAAAAVCAYTGECNTNSKTCTDQGQTCIDPDEKRTGDWMCSCVPPMAGSKVGGVASCTYDECIENGDVCTAVGQLCYDKDTSATSLGNWECRCPDGTGVKDKAPATCSWRGECKLSENYRTCTAAGQTCTDPNENAPGDWQCECVNPQSGSPSPVSPAYCIQDECKGDTKAALLCASAGQKCVDPNPSPNSLGDWMCQCVPSSSGSAVGTLAQCSQTGECVDNSRICTSAGQYCTDTKLSTTNDWECNCLNPAVGKSLVQAANCTLDECISNGYKCGNRQQCVDPNKSPTSLNDWRCDCTVGTGSARARAATCIVNECEEYASVCYAVGQTCTDPNPSNDIRGDWMCTCAGSSTGSAVAYPAKNCIYRGECAVKAPVCTAAGQACFDPDENTANDWQCMCVNPMGTSETMKPAMCILDECAAGTVGQETCASAGQTCSDDKPYANSTNDWRCNCLSPAIGQGQGRTADCTWQGECVQNYQVCTSARQTCDDPNTNVKGDWQCACVAPYTGQKAIAQPATCLVDECQLQTVCTAKGQECKDPSQSVMGDWYCQCVGDGTGTQIAGPAVCSYGSTACTNNFGVCTSVGQYCVADTSASNGFSCACVSPFTGTPKQNGPTVCYQSLTNECDSNTVCTNAGQLCIDPEPSSLGNWRCVCKQDSSRYATGKPYAGECNAPTGPTRVRMALTIPGDTTPNTASLASDIQTVLRFNGQTTAMVQNVSVASDGRGGQRVVFDVIDANGNTNLGMLGEDYREELSTGLPSRGWNASVVQVGDCAVAGTAVLCSNPTHMCTDTDGTATGSNYECQCPSPQHGKQLNGPVTNCISECDTCTTASSNLTMALANSPAYMESNKAKFLEALSTAMGVPQSAITGLKFSPLGNNQTNATFTVSAKTNETNAALESRILGNANKDINGNNVLAMDGFTPQGNASSVNPAASSSGSDDDDVCFGQELGGCIGIIAAIVIGALLLLALLYFVCRKSSEPSAPYQKQPAPEPEPVEMLEADEPYKKEDPPTNVYHEEPNVLLTPSREGSPVAHDEYHTEMASAYPSGRGRGGGFAPPTGTEQASPTSADGYPFSSVVYPSMGRGRGVAASPSFVESPMSTRGRGGYVSAVDTEAAPGTSGWV